MNGLTANTTYHVRAYATNTAGTVYGGEVSFTTSAIAPTVTTQAVSAIAATTATGNGNITSLGVPNPTAHGVCWNTAGTPTTADSVTDLGRASATGAFSAAMNGLTANTTYHVRAYATNSAGTVYGGEVSFASSAIAPTAVTAAASGITTTGAILNGTVNANNQSSSVTFEYGLTAAYGTSISATPSPVSGISATPVSGGITGLFPNSIYHFRVVAENATGTTFGSDLTFTTLAAAPTVATLAASTVTPAGATLNGTVNANNQSTTVIFEYGLTTAYGTTVNADQSPLSGSAATSVYRAVGGLVPEVTYHYRVVGQNATGTAYGTDQAFTTPHLNVAPTAWPDDYKIMENEFLRVPAAGVLANDTDPEAGPLNARLLDPSSHGRVTLRSDGSFTYAADQDFSGTDRFVYVANDGALDSNAAEVTIKIVAVNDPPTVRITSPGNNDLVNGLVAIVAEANDDQQVAAVTFLVDGAALADRENRTDRPG